VNPARIGHWSVSTVMAATLTELWSRRLLPADSREAKSAHAESEALRQQLLDRPRMLSASDWLERRRQLGCDGPPGAVPLRRCWRSDRALRAHLVALRVPERTRECVPLDRADTAERPRRHALDAREAGERDGAAGAGGRGL
jgi:hypothetical protein